MILRTSRLHLLTSSSPPLRYQRLSDAGAGQLRLLPTIPQGGGEDPRGAVSVCFLSEENQSPGCFPLISIFLYKKLPHS